MNLKKLLLATLGVVAVTGVTAAVVSKFVVNKNKGNTDVEAKYSITELDPQITSKLSYNTRVKSLNELSDKIGKVVDKVSYDKIKVTNSGSFEVYDDEKKMIPANLQYSVTYSYIYEFTEEGVHLTMSYLAHNEADPDVDDIDEDFDDYIYFKDKDTTEKNSLDFNIHKSIKKILKKNYVDYKNSTRTLTFEFSTIDELHAKDTNYTPSSVKFVYDSDIIEEDFNKEKLHLVNLIDEDVEEDTDVHKKAYKDIDSMYQLLFNNDSILQVASNNKATIIISAIAAMGLLAAALGLVSYFRRR